MSQTPMPFAATRSQQVAEQEPPTLVAGETRRRRGRRSTILLVLLLLICSGLAAYSVVLFNNQRALRAALDSARADGERLLAGQQTSQAQAQAANERAEASRAKQGELQKALEAKQEELVALQQQLADESAQKKELEAMAARFQRMIDSGKLKVSLRRGRMVVDLPSQVLFPSGSAELTDEGKRSLREVSRILRSVRGKRFIVGGHTDSKPIVKQTEFTSNWALSAARAVTVTEAMVRAGLRPSHLVAAGYGPHDPVGTNRTEAGRQENRRIEIILEPRVRALPQASKK